MIAQFELPESHVSSDWLVFLAILLAVGLGVGCFVVWFYLFGKGSKKKRRQRRRHHRKLNPTLAQTGGLPPPREPNQPPRGV